MQEKLDAYLRQGISKQNSRLQAVAARRRRKVVDRLRERRLAQHEFGVSRALQKEMDEIHLQFQARRPSH